MRLEIEDLSKRYGDTDALDHVTLSVPAETNTLTLIGPSGGGKSTLLRLIGGLEPADSGSIRVDGNDIASGDLLQQRRRNGYLFQSFNLFPHLDALANITLPLEKVHGSSATDAKHRANECLERFGMASHSHKRPNQLSGGQQQRVALARAIAHEPELLILDEPTSALDPEMTSEVLELIAKLREEGQSIVLSTHEIGFAKSISDQVAFLADGKVTESGPADTLFGSPETSALTNFLSKVTRFH